ncbi:ArsR/SmtB family transcription factor [Methyloceanibacter stevinii]|uniref:ArsR/SmtB family transcription factor n=1 Tax=Methyloceanibacter stevinii TaxID=1774970 RepID=UPI000849D423|nr:methyltransferase domain-containing protein [Methyloceanibacter stevinii]
MSDGLQHTAQSPEAPSAVAGKRTAAQGLDSGQGLSSAQVLAALRGAGEATRLRILALLAATEHNVKDLTQILVQSQPRISRHLKLMAEAGIITRFREARGFSSASPIGPRRARTRIVDSLDPSDLTLARDRARAEAVQKARAEAAQDYFKAHAAEWDSIRALHVAESQVEEAMEQALGPGPFELLVDLGTGTGRILELFGPRADKALGFDLNHDMLAYARAKLEREGLAQAQVRHGDLYNIPLPDGAADAVVVHQVLHFLDDPAAAVAEAARLLAPGGRLLVVDFAPHELEFLREQSAHRRLGFGRAQLGRMMETTGLKLLSFQDMNPLGSASPDKASPEGKLTVSLWLGEKPAATGKTRRRNGKVEVAA